MRVEFCQYPMSRSGVGALERDFFICLEIEVS